MGASVGASVSASVDVSDVHSYVDPSLPVSTIFAAANLWHFLMSLNTIALIPRPSHLLFELSYATFPVFGPSLLVPP